MKEHGIDATAREGTSSQFDVLHDGALVYSKAKAHRFPEPGEVLALLQG